jgi:isopentenyl diphosphate isomerase/L-lactate dehydrogenase-like FMN-dependent dehydrogenase
MQYTELKSTALALLVESGLGPEWLNLACETQSQHRLNREYIDRIVFETRLIDATHADLKTELLGVSLTSPVIASTMSRGRVLENVKHTSVPWFMSPPYVEQMARAIGSVGSMFGVGAVEVDELEDLSNQGAPLYHIVKPMPDEGQIRSHLEAAVAAGCVAVGMDITPAFGHKAWDEDPTTDKHTEPKSADQLRSYVEATSLPFILKGVLSVQDARKAQDVGAAGIVVSNHGGECIDYSMPILQALPRIKEAVPDMAVIVDSGFRRGTDILKALCLGADAVAVATPLVIGYVAAGELGVVAMMDALNAELRRTMSAVGFGSTDAVDSSVLHLTPDPQSVW